MDNSTETRLRDLREHLNGDTSADWRYYHLRNLLDILDDAGPLPADPAASDAPDQPPTT